MAFWLNLKLNLTSVLKHSELVKFARAWFAVRAVWAVKFVSEKSLRFGLVLRSNLICGEASVLAWALFLNLTLLAAALKGSSLNLP